MRLDELHAAGVSRFGAKTPHPYDGVVIYREANAMTATAIVTYHKTPIAVKLIGCTIGQLLWLIRSGRLERPEKDSSGDYMWTDADIAAARAAGAKTGARRPRTTPTQPAGTGSEQTP